MATRFRTITTGIWEDEWFASLGADGKVLWFYLLTNHRVSVAGIYLIQQRFMSFETGLAPGVITDLLAKFQQDGKVMYCGNVIWVRKLREYQRGAGGPKIEKLIETDLATIPNGPVKEAYCIQYGYSMDTVSIPHPYPIDTVSIPHHNSIDTPSKTPSEYSIDTVSIPSMGACAGGHAHSDSDSDSDTKKGKSNDRLSSVDRRGESRDPSDSVSLSSGPDDTGSAAEPPKTCYGVVLKGKPKPPDPQPEPSPGLREPTAEEIAEANARKALFRRQFEQLKAEEAAKAAEAANAGAA